MNSIPKKGDVIVVWFSCGAASAVAAKKTIEKYGDVCTVRVVNNSVKEEDGDNVRFLRDVEKWIGVEIELASNPNYPDNSADSVWRRRSAMAFPRGAPCTENLKKRARQPWEDRNHHDWMVMGFASDEVKRSDNFLLTERVNLLPVLIDEGLTKQDCFNILIGARIQLPFIYSLGFPNANCIGCPKATSPTYWNLVRKHFPAVFAARAELSKQLGARLVRVKGVRLFLEDLDSNAKGRSLKSLKMPECGIFCEEKV